MQYLDPQFAQAESSGGISALGLNLKSFIFQLITFVIMLLILRRWVFPRLVATLEKRRETLEQSLVHARQTQEVLASAELKAVEILKKARQQADAALDDAKKQAEQTIASSELAAEQRVARILKEAEAQLEQERQKLRLELRSELVDLAILTTEKVIRQKLDEESDRHLIEASIKELAR